MLNAGEIVNWNSQVLRLGQFARTGFGTDLAIAGNGFFVETAADLARTRQQETFAHQITARLELYKAGKPYHDSVEQLRNLKMAS